MQPLKNRMRCVLQHLLRLFLNFSKIKIILKTYIIKHRNGKPSARMVLLKSFSDEGFIFFTNYTSKKGQELDANPQASLCFYWDVMSRQIRIDGLVKKIAREESADYFNKRPLNSRVSAYISDQSKVIKNREVKTFFKITMHYSNLILFTINFLSF